MKQKEGQFNFASRIKRLQRMLVKEKTDACMLSSSHDIDAATYYFSGDETNPTILFITPEFSAISSLHQQDFASYFDECIPLSSFRKRIVELFKTHKVRKLAVDDSSTTAGMAVRYQQRFPKLKTIAFSDQLSEMRNVKEPLELDFIKKAQAITNTVLDEVGGLYSKGKLWGKTENLVAGMMEKRVRELGGSLDAFPPMVLSGSRSAFFHNNTSNMKIGSNRLVLCDVGARWKFFCGDATRTYYNGKDERIKHAIEVCEESKRVAEKKARVGIEGKSVSDAALKVIEESGWGKYSYRKAGLSLGHFLGLRVHDGTSFEKARLKPSMAFTIEPGIYVPGEFGIRIEDVTILKAD